MSNHYALHRGTKSAVVNYTSKLNKFIENEIGFVVTGSMQRGVGRGIGRIWSKGTNFQSTTQPGQKAGRGDSALRASAPAPRSRRSPGAKHPLRAHHQPTAAASPKH